MSTNKYYEEYWTDGGLNPLEVELSDDVAAILERLAPPGSRCLDIGCGAGDKVTHWVKNSGVEYLGVDISATAVEAAKAKGLDVQLIDDSGQLPFEDESFDIVTCFEVMEHLFDPIAVAREARRVLRPGGVMILTLSTEGNLRAIVRNQDCVSIHFNLVGFLSSGLSKNPLASSIENPASTSMDFMVENEKKRM